MQSHSVMAFQEVYKLKKYQISRNSRMGEEQSYPQKCHPRRERKENCLAQRRTAQEKEMQTPNINPESLGSILGTVLLLSSPYHLPQLEFLGEFTRECAQILHCVMARREESILGGNLPVSLDAQFEVGDEGVRNLVHSAELAV